MDTVVEGAGETNGARLRLSAGMRMVTRSRKWECA